jgi:D-cysteine desulfhydrase
MKRWLLRCPKLPRIVESQSNPPPLVQALSLGQERVGWVRLGDFPTPITRLPCTSERPQAFVKRDDLSSSIYGGNKVRTLEVLFGQARRAGVQSIFAAGAYGSNHAVATALHAPRAGMKSGALLFPQPISWAALENLRVTLQVADYVTAVPHWSVLPFMMWSRARSEELGTTAVMLPGGATPWGALGYVSAAFELARQVAAGQLPSPVRIVVGVGSTCTSAGLLLGLALAVRLRLGLVSTPELISARVTPWPVTSAYRIVGLAERTSRLLVELSGDAGLRMSRVELAARLSIDGRFLGRGYGRATPTGRAAMREWSALGLPPLDTTYSAKAAASFLRHCQSGEATLFWSTKSAAALPEVTEQALESAPRAMQRWMRRAERALHGELPDGYRSLRERSGA